MMRRPWYNVAALVLALLGIGAPAPTAAGPGVTIALTPQTQQVVPGSLFDLFIEVTQAGDPFNGFDAVIGYDPTALMLVPMNPIDLQQGAYMTGACGNTFHVFKAHAGIDTITDVLLCSGVALPGPGQIYHVRFQASDTPQLTQVQFRPGVRFYNAGLNVLPLTSSDAVITIGSPVGVGASEPARLALTVAPNPSHGNLIFTIGSDGAGQASLTLFDLQGRVVRRFENEGFSSGVRAVRWNGRSDSDTSVAPGIYLARLTVGERAVWRRVILIQ
jgi:hypothetical protein